MSKTSDNNFMKKIKLNGNNDIEYEEDPDFEVQSNNKSNMSVFEDSPEHFSPDNYFIREPNGLKTEVFNTKSDDKSPEKRLINKTHNSFVLSKFIFSLIPLAKKQSKKFEKPKESSNPSL